MRTNPLATMWDALEHAGCGPHGKPFDYRAQCPIHGENPDALHVIEGVDSRVVLYCHARKCAPEDIVAAVGLTMSDLFPASTTTAPGQSGSGTRAAASSPPPPGPWPTCCSGCNASANRSARRSCATARTAGPSRLASWPTAASRRSCTARPGAPPGCSLRAS